MAFLLYRGKEITLKAFKRRWMENDLHGPL
jgi:hypothetical protein